MPRRHFFRRLFVSLVAVGILTAVVVSWSDDRAFKRGAVRLSNEELQQLAMALEQLAGPAMRGEATIESLRRSVTELGAASAIRFTVVDPTGKVIAESDEDPLEMDDHGRRPEIQEARTGGYGIARRKSRSLGHEMVYLARAVRTPDGELLGFARVARDADAFDAALAEGRQQIWLAILIGTATAAILAWLLARHIARPIAVLERTAHEMADSTERRRAPIAGDDELAALARALNTLADRLEQRVDEMRAERAKLSAILGGMVEGVTAVDAEERVLHLNGAAVDMLGIDDPDVVGRPLVEVTRIPEICELVATTLRSGEKATRETAIRRGTETVVVQLEAAPLRNGDDSVRGALLVMHDVTELRRLESMRRDFVANVSHELKTPLTAIKGIVDTIVEDPYMPDDTRHRFLEKVQRQVDRLGNLVSDLLVLARIESWKPGEEMLAIDLRQPVHESCNHLAVSAAQKKLRLEVALPDRPVSVRGESESLRQIVDNLLGNAIRYTPENGEIRVALVERDGNAILSVRDTGIGIAAEHLDRIFVRFYRVDKARSRELGGTGLGLAIVKHVALAHGGAVSVQSRIGVGSTFTVRIPLHETSPAKTAGIGAP
jgi:two-component system phosphate regulon sensor histidine kinase PhoR